MEAAYLNSPGRCSASRPRIQAERRNFERNPLSNAGAAFYPPGSAFFEFNGETLTLCPSRRTPAAMRPMREECSYSPPVEFSLPTAPATLRYTPLAEHTMALGHQRSNRGHRPLLQRMRTMQSVAPDSMSSRRLSLMGTTRSGRWRCTPRFLARATNPAPCNAALTQV